MRWPYQAAAGRIAMTSAGRIQRQGGSLRRTRQSAANSSGSEKPIIDRVKPASAVKRPATRYQRGSSSASTHADTAHRNRNVNGTSVMACAAYFRK